MHNNIITEYPPLIANKLQVHCGLQIPSNLLVSARMSSIVSISLPGVTPCILIHQPTSHQGKKRASGQRLQHLVSFQPTRSSSSGSWSWLEALRANSLAERGPEGRIVQVQPVWQLHLSYLNYQLISGAFGLPQWHGLAVFSSSFQPCWWIWDAS